MPFNAHASLPQFHLIKLLEVFFEKRIQLFKSISNGCCHFNSTFIYFFHGPPHFIHLDLKLTANLLWLKFKYTSILLGFAFNFRLLEVDVLINVMMMCWTYPCVISYFPSCVHAPTQTFQPFSANGLNEQASPIVIFLNDILSTAWMHFTSPTILCLMRLNHGW